MNARELAVGLLSRRDHAEGELRQKLAQRDVLPEEIEPAIEYCRENGWLDDCRFAHSLLRHGMAKGHGWLRICQDAKRKGLDKELLSRAEQEQMPDWYELAKQVAFKKFADRDGQLPEADIKMRAKRMRYLQYRGFNFDQISYALSQDSEHSKPQ